MFACSPNTGGFQTNPFQGGLNGFPDIPGSTRRPLSGYPVDRSGYPSGRVGYSDSRGGYPVRRGGYSTRAGGRWSWPAGGYLSDRPSFPHSLNNRVRSIVGKPPVYPLQLDDSSTVCQKIQCGPSDIDCLLNKTKSIQWQYVALPTIRQLQNPIEILNVQTIGSSVYPNLYYTIVSGNTHGYFGVVKNTDDAQKAVLRLLKPIEGPLIEELKLRMDNVNSYGNLVSRHIANVAVYVSRYDF